MLSIQTKDRMEKDIDIMEKCTSFLFFFQNIKLDDPENEYDSHRRTCQCLKHEEHNKGYFICKYSNTIPYSDESANDFYIILKGEIGVFVPRPTPHVVGEMNAVERMCRRLDKYELEKEDIEEYIRVMPEDKEKKQFLSKIERVSKGNKIELEYNYVAEKLGGIPFEKMASENFFNNVRYYVTKGRVPDFQQQLRPKKRVNVRRTGVDLQEKERSSLHSG